MYNIFKTIKTYKDVFIIAIFIMLFGANIALRKDNNNLKTNIDAHYANELAYQNMLNGSTLENNVLQLKIDDMQNAYDNVVMKMNNTMDSLKIVRKDLKSASSITQKIDTTIVAPIEREDTTSCDFTKVLQPNDLTKITVKSVADSLHVTIDLLNEQQLFVYNKKVYRNPNKKIVMRILTFDWKKRKEVRYHIVNSNDLIKVTSTRIIEIIDK